MRSLVLILSLSLIFQAYSNRPHTHTHAHTQTASCPVRPDFKKAWTLSTGGYYLATQGSGTVGLNFEATKAFNRVIVGVGHNRMNHLYSQQEFRAGNDIGTGSTIYISASHVPFQNLRTKVFQKVSLGVATNYNYQPFTPNADYVFESSLSGSWDLCVQHLPRKRGFYRPSIGASIGVYSNLQHLGYDEAVKREVMPLPGPDHTNNQFIGFRAEITLGFVIMGKQGRGVVF